MSRKSQGAAVIYGYFPHMVAIIIMTGTKYACNFQNRPWVTWVWFLDESRVNKISMIASISGHIERDCKHLYSTSSSLFRIWGYKHIWYTLKLRLHPYKANIVIIFASVFGPNREFAQIFGLYHKNYCNHMWSISIIRWTFDIRQFKFFDSKNLLANRWHFRGFNVSFILI